MQQPIECVAVPIERARQKQSSQVGTWVIVGFLLVLCLKIIGLLMISAWVVRRFPKTVFAAAATIPLFGALRKSRLRDDSASRSIKAVS